MKTHTHLLDPTHEREAAIRQRRDLLPGFEGRTVALLDIGKARGDVFIDRLEQRFAEAGVATKRFLKPTNTRNAPAELAQKIASESDAVVEALSD